MQIIRLIVTLFVLLPLPHSAYSGPPQPLYAGIDNGGIQLEDSAHRGLVSGNVDSIASARFTRLFFGYNFNNQYALEIGSFRTGKSSSVMTSEWFGPYTETGYLMDEGIDLSAVWFPLANHHAKHGFFLKAGVHHSHSHDEYSGVSEGLNFYGNRLGGIEWSGTLKNSGAGHLFGVGYNLSSPNQWFVRFTATQYMRLSGLSGRDGTSYVVGVGANF